MQRPCSHKDLSNQRQLQAAKEEVKNVEVVMATLNGLPGSWHSFMRGSVPEGSDYFKQTLGRRRSLTHKKKREDESNWRSSSHHPKKIPQSMINMKISTLEELLIHLSIRIRNDAIMNEEVDEAEDSRRSIPMKQIKISIQLSFHDIVLLYIWLYSVDVLFMIDCLH